MSNGNKLRISLALVTLAGALQLDRAHAAEAASVAPCDSWAQGYGAGFCAAKGQAPASIAYICNADGTATILSISCFHLPT
jgi:hypothetical protein